MNGYHDLFYVWKEFRWLLYWEGKGNGNPLQYSCLENPMDGGAWWAAVHGVTKSRAQLSDFTFTFHFHSLEKEMATHSSIPAWRIPGTGEPGGLPFMGSHRVGHDWSDLAAAAVLRIVFRWVLRGSKETIKKATTIIHRIDISNVGNSGRSGRK